MYQVMLLDLYPRRLRLEDLLQNAPQVVVIFPLRIVRLEFSDIRDIPDVIAGAVFISVAVLQFLAGNLFAQGDRFHHRAIAVARAPDVVDLAAPWILIEVI